MSGAKMAALRRSCLVLAVALLVASCAGSMAGKKHRRHHHHGQKKAAAAPSSTAAAKVAAAGNMRFTEVGAQLVNTRQAVSRAYVDAAAAANQPIVAQEVQQVQQKPALPAAAAQPVSMRQQQQQQQQQQGVSADSLLRFQQTGSRGGLFGKTAGLAAKGGSTSSGSKSGSPSSSGAKSGMMASMGMGSTTPAMGAPADWPVPSASDKKGGAQFVPFGKHIPRQTEMQYFVSTVRLRRVAWRVYSGTRPGSSGVVVALLLVVVGGW